MTGIRGKLAAARERDLARFANWEPPEEILIPVPRREPLTAPQHILHLLLTVFTAGLWLPVWIIRSMQGNRQR